MILKVQRTDGAISANALIESGFDIEGKRLTFLAYSDAMKARILEKIAHGAPYRVYPTTEPPRDGEWFEDPCD